MATLIFNDYSEIKPFISGGQVTNDLEMLEGDLLFALENNIVPTIGNATWEMLLAAFEDDSYNDYTKKATNYLRGALANLAYANYSIGGGIQATNNGLMQSVNSENKSAYQWQTLEWREAKRDTGFLYLGKLLSYLEANKSEFTAWEESDERADYIEFFIRDVNVYNRYRKIGGFETLLALMPYMRRVQEKGLKSTITDDLYEDIHTKYKAGTSLSANEGKLIPLIQDYIAHQSLLDALYELNFKFTANGIRLESIETDQRNSKKVVNAISEVDKAKTYLQQSADIALSNITQFLKATASEEVFVPYYNAVVLVEAEEGNAISNKLEQLKTGPTFCL